jgi:endonuclease/exonuclease/phosphatase family metal-dependent hydrolase
VTTLRIATFNVLFNHAGVGHGAWEERRLLARRAVGRARPDVLGLQEIFPSMLGDVREIAAGLEIVAGPTSGPPRFFDVSLPIGLALEAIRTGKLPHRVFVRARGSERMKTGQHQPIAYRADRVRPLESGGFWISPAPDLPASMLPLAPTPFLVHWVRFERLDVPRRMLVLNAHYGHAPWHHGATARVTAERIARLAPPDAHEARATDVFLLGDFNAWPTSPLVRRLTSPPPRGAGLVDALRTAPERTGPPVTFHWGRGAIGAGLSLDYVLARTPMRVKSAEVIEEREGELYPSDHHPVVIEFED